MANNVGLRSERGPILLSLMLGTFLIAIDATILSTAVPTIVRELGGFAQFPWLFSIYLLAQAASVPVYGKLADTVGRKPIMFVGVGLFLLGSILCGSAWDMTSLIVFRAVQGLGAGAMLARLQEALDALRGIDDRHARNAEAEIRTAQAALQEARGVWLAGYLRDAEELRRRITA